MSEIIPLFECDTTMQPTVNEPCVELLEDMLERAKSGQVIGVAMGILYYDKMSAYAIGGMVGGHSLIGTLDVAKAHLISHHIVEDEQD